MGRAAHELDLRPSYLGNGPLNGVTLVRQTAAVDDDCGPRYLRLDDGRLLTWFYNAPDRVSGFQLTFDDWTGTKPIPTEQGLAILAEQHRRRDGRLLGPVVEPPMGALGRRFGLKQIVTKTARSTSVGPCSASHS